VKVVDGGDGAVTSPGQLVGAGGCLGIRERLGEQLQVRTLNFSDQYRVRSP